MAGLRFRHAHRTGAWLTFIMFSLLALACTLLARTPGAPAPPNIVLIVTDDQRFDMLGSVDPLLVTPNMDRLAAAGARFENAFVTSPICAASRASLLTGVVERTHRYTFGTPPLSKALLAQSYPALLRAGGYRTAFVGKFGVDLERGTERMLFDDYRPLQPTPYLKPQADGSVRHLTDITADEVIDVLDDQQSGVPFMLTVSFNAPHAEDADPRQYIWPPAMDELYRDTAVPRAPLGDPAFHAALPEFLREPAANLNRTRWFWRFDSPQKAVAMTRGYWRMISGVDAAIGRIRRHLDELGLADDTVILLTSDNGYFLGERGYAGKWLPHEPSIRVPLIVHDPRAPEHAGARPTGMALNIDVAPTLLELAGLPVPDSMQGRSLLPLLGGLVPGGWRTDFFVEHLMAHPQIAKHEGVRAERYKYARYFEQEPVFEELYDLESDPLEAVNLAGDPAYSERLEELRARCDQLRDGYAAAAIRSAEQ